MVKRKWRPFVDDVKARKVRKELAVKKMKESRVEEDVPLGNNNNPTWLRSFNAEVRTMHPDFHKFLESSI